MTTTQERRQRQEATPQERRRFDRRHSDRRRPDPPPEESWFGALGVTDTELHGTWSEESHFVGGWPEPPRVSDSRFLSRQARRIVSSGASTFQRIFRLLVGARAALGVALLLAQVIGSTVGARSHVAMLAVSCAYAAQAVALWLLPRLRPSSPEVTPVAKLKRSQWLATIGVDLLAFTVLHLLEPAPNFNYVALLVLPVLMAGVLMPRLMALATASGVALMLLGAAWRAALFGGDVAVPLTQAGLAGIGFFVITLLAGELAGRLAREELTARGSLELARQQAQLNRLVIEEMADGVLVVDHRARVRAANPAARRLLVAQGVGASAPFQLQGAPAWEALSQAVGRAFEERTWPEAGRDLTLHFDGGATRTLRVRARFTRRRPLADETDAPEELCVLFLEDLRNVQARNRQEKLAAMGRVSAGIAHEIRNPLAAIAQANALLQEDVTSDGQAQLAGIVADNVERLKRIVDDVMEVAPGAPPSLRLIDARSEVAAATSEWARTVQLPLGEASRLRIELPGEPLAVLFDPEHLRRVLVNLLDNARRHASDAAGAIVLALRAVDGERALLSVASDGPPIPSDVERHLFEPFFSTRSRGTGLGLYICKELCERYGAGIDYRVRPESSANRNEFLVTMRRALLASN
jgi:two-component system sensor histidine kinase PilS (NtrC family)